MDELKARRAEEGERLEVLQNEVVSEIFVTTLGDVLTRWSFRGRGATHPLISILSNFCKTHNTLATTSQVPQPRYWSHR